MQESILVISQKMAKKNCIISQNSIKALEHIYKNVQNIEIELLDSVC